MDMCAEFSPVHHSSRSRQSLSSPTSGIEASTSPQTQRLCEFSLSRGTTALWFGRYRSYPVDIRGRELREVMGEKEKVREEVGNT